MFQQVKQIFCDFIKELNYKITDNGTYQETFPWLMLRTGNITSSRTMNTRTDEYLLTLDIFSTYNGEKEILEIVEHINSNIFTMIENHPQIQFVELRNFKILDDKNTGPVRKHGVAVFAFLLSQSYEEVANGTGN